MKFEIKEGFRGNAWYVYNDNKDVYLNTSGKVTEFKLIMDDDAHTNFYFFDSVEDAVKAVENAGHEYEIV